MFLDMRRDSFNNGNGNFLRHKRVLNYERKGTSKRYTWQTLKNDCTTIFFPGCALPGTRPQKTLQLYSYLQSHDPDMGLVLDCCSRPSHDLGRQPCFEAAFSNLNTTLIRKGIQKVIVACPSCYEVFSQYGKGLEITTIYEYMVRQGFAVKGCLHGEVTVHDPCVIREKSDLHDAVRTLIRAHGLTICEMTHAKEKTLCCGEGGAVASIDKNLSRQWGRRRKRESMGRPILTYCAGCAAELNKSSPTYHLIDLLFEPEKTINGKVRVSRAPITYLNRLCLKKTLQRQR
jgi:Fe-S oxidoreductase